MSDIKVIGKGTYSNVISPPLYCLISSNCINYINDNQLTNQYQNDVSKLFKTSEKKDEFEDETEILKKIISIPNYTDFTV